MREIALPLTGGCHCGAVRYELTAAPYLAYVCHCTDCQRQTGSAYGMSMPAPRAAFRVTKGDPASYRRTTPSGRIGVGRFCGACGTRVFSESTPEIITLRPGTLDDASWVVPAAQIWTRSAHPWACLDDVVSNDENPDGYEAATRAWRAAFSFAPT
jgi:hypothetical protein